MKLSLLLIYENLHSPEAILKTPVPSGPMYKGIRVLPETPKELDSKYLYVDLHQASIQYDQDVWTNISLVSVQNYATEAATNAIIIEKSCNIIDIFNQLMDIFDRFQNWENATRDALLSKQSIQDIINLCKIITPETVYITNLSLKMIAHTSPTIMSDISAIWNYQETYGYMPMNIVKALLDSGELDKIYSYKNAFTIPTTTFNLPYTCRNIFCDNVMRAHIFIVSIYSKPIQTNKEIAEILGKLLVGYVSDNVDFFSLSGQLHEHFFRDVLLGKLTDYLLIKQQLSSFSWNIDDGYLLFVMEKVDKPVETIRIFTHYLERSSYDCRSLEQDNDLIVVFHVERDFKKQHKIHDMVATQLEKLNCKGAFSKWFANFTDMKIYYQQSKVIISFCNNIPNAKNLLIEEEFGLYSFIKIGLENHNAFQVCHPGIITLYEYDKKNLTEYLETLFQYLICDRNIVKASKALFIHRNTMNYRMEKINSLIDFDEENPDIKSYVLMSIYILKYVLKMQHPDPDVH